MLNFVPFFKGMMCLKPFLDYNAQLKKLSDDKGLIITDEEKAKVKLNEIGYFTLIGGYKDLLRDSNTRKYFDGVTFDDVLEIYNFDTSIRELFFHYICKIEKHMRSVISYEFCYEHGENQAEYLDCNTYRYKGNSTKNQKQIKKLTKMLKEVVKSKKYPYINHQRNAYKNIPLWVLINALEFGKISTMYEMFKISLQIKVSNNFVFVTNGELIKFMKVLVSFRNVCAHHERFFSYKSQYDIPDTLIHKKLNIQRNNGRYMYGKKDVFAVLIACMYLLSREDFLKLKRELFKEIEDFLSKDKAIKRKDLYAHMGFPNNVKDITRYRKLK